MKDISLQNIPAQRFNCVLGGQNVAISLYQRGDYQYMDVSVNGEEIRNGVICLTGINMLLYPMAGFSGYLFFVDLKDKNGTPNYAEYGTRFVLCYADEDEAR